MSYDRLTTKILKCIRNRPGKRQTAQQWTALMPPDTPVENVRHRLMRLSNAKEIKTYKVGHARYFYFEESHENLDAS